MLYYNLYSCNKRPFEIKHSSSFLPIFSIFFLEGLTINLHVAKDLRLMTVIPNDAIKTKEKWLTFKFKIIFYDIT